MPMPQNAVEQMDAEIADLQKQMEQGTPPEGEQPPEPEQATEPAPEPEGEPEQTQPEDKAEQRDKNLAQALEEERRARRDAQKQADERQREYDQRMAILQDRLDRLTQAREQATQQPVQDDFGEYPEEVRDALKAGKPTVSFDDDPGAWIKQKDAIDQYQHKQLRSFIDDQRQSTERQSNHEHFINHLRSQEFEFAQQAPDYQEAVQHLSRSQLQHLTAMGYPLAEAQQMVTNLQLQSAARAMRQGKNPAQIAYEAARALGYKGKEAEQAATPQTNGQAGEQQQAPQQPAPKQQSGGQDMEKLAAGQKEAQSIGAVSGGGGGRLTAERLIEMDEKEFEATLQKMTPQQRRELMGV